MNTFKSLDAIERPSLTTNEAAFYLNRQPQTLRNWATRNDGPIKCTRIGGRLAWPTAAVRELLDALRTEKQRA